MDIEQWVKDWFNAWLWVPWIMHQCGAPDILCMVAFFGGSVGIPAFVAWLFRKPLLWVLDLTGISWLFFKPQLKVTTTHPDGSKTVEIFNGTQEQWEERERRRAAQQQKT